MERLIQDLYASLGFKAEWNQLLPPAIPDGTLRQIDVLVSRTGQPQEAIECKNESVITDTAHIDKWVGVLQDIGYKTDQGTYVSVSGYTKDALARAKRANVKPLQLYGLDLTRMAPDLQPTSQSVVFVVLRYMGLQIATSSYLPLQKSELNAWLVYFNAAGEYIGSIIDVIDVVQQRWVAGAVPAVLGDYELAVQFPEGIRCFVNGEEMPPPEIKMSLQVSAHVVGVPGQAERYVLMNALTDQPDGFRIEATFNEERSFVRASWLLSEQDLSQAVEAHEVVRIALGRIRAPRIVLSSFYWPLSRRALDRYYLACKDIRAGKLVHLDLAAVEGTNLSALFEAPAYKSWADLARSEPL